MTATGWAGILDGEIDCVFDMAQPFEYDSQAGRIYKTKEQAEEYYEKVVMVKIDDV
jgi:hypothetical protein